MNNTGEIISQMIMESIDVKRKVLEDRELLALIETVANGCLEVYQKGGKILIAGNGGSAADAQHIAAELVGRFYLERQGLPCIALSTNTSILTAVGNDYGFEPIFARQIEAHGKQGDLFIGLSTSGNSKNILLAVEQCQQMGITTVGMTGEEGGLMNDLCDYCLRIPSFDTPRIQETHITIGHILCFLIEKGMFE